MAERTYNDDEVADIFARAAERSDARQSIRHGEGMTLAALQEIGRDVGLSPGAVARAAEALDRQLRAASQTFLGLPIGVGQTIELDRRLTEAEWERLIVDLRETFDARGTVRSDGSFREWTNGNLQVLVEPTETGHQVRLRTAKGVARVQMTTGLGILAGAAATLVAVAAAGGLGDAGSVAGITFLSLVGAGFFGAGAAGLPRWARLRRRQMEAIVDRLTSAESIQIDDRSAELD